MGSAFGVFALLYRSNNNVCPRADKVFICYVIFKQPVLTDMHCSSHLLVRIATIRLMPRSAYGNNYVVEHLE